MKHSKRSTIKRNFSINNGFKAVCSVEIYEREDGKTEVVLSEPDDIQYQGISTTNFFEEFATGIKHELLKNTPHGNIVWVDLLKFNSDAYPDVRREVALTFNGMNYLTPNRARS